MSNEHKLGLVQVTERYWDNTNNCEPTYPMPCIVWWQKGYGTDIWYKGELLCEQFPNGELVEIALYLENLVDTLTELYQEVLEAIEEDAANEH